tara:strand:- start:2247 stop:2498 length:252 start_codon:yes stop_codon:yes gene_type:complete
LNIKEKAQRYDRLAKDDVFKELFEDVRNDAIGVFLNQSRDDEAINQARNLIDALTTIETKINAALLNDAVNDKQKGKQQRGND